MVPPPDRPRTPARRSSGGGALIALGAVGGAAVGFLTRQPTAAFLVGTGLGMAAALLVWWAGRRR